MVATALGTADFVSSISSARRTPVYLIQHFEDFGVDREEVLRTWRLPMRRVAVSSWLVDIAINEGLNCDLVENGIDLDVFRPGPPTEQREPSVLAMVSDQSWKRTDLVVEMMQEIERLHPDFVLRTFGTCDRPSDLPATVTHHRDPLPDALVDLYQRSQVFVCASDFEGFGLPALEAMACGSAVVSTDNGGVPAFSRGAAEVVPSGSARALVERVLSLMSDRASRVEVCDRGHRRAMELSLPNSCLAFETILVDSVNVDV